MKMTNEESVRMLNFCKTYAKFMKPKAPHLDYDELVGELTLVCLTIYEKYGYQEVLFKKACHARTVDLVRFNVKRPSISVEDLTLDIMNNDEAEEFGAKPSKSLASEVESEDLINNLVRFLFEVTDEDSKARTYCQLRYHTEGLEFNPKFAKLVHMIKGSENQIAYELGYTNGSSSGGYKHLKYVIQVLVAYYFHELDQEDYLPEEWRNLGDQYYNDHKVIKRFITKREYQL